MQIQSLALLWNETKLIHKRCTFVDGGISAMARGRST
jgi:hypothetical protein